ncbi:MAG TPA: GNAT family N-acetyltransferase [Caulobacteraceae bacterium]|nr:GNAT family N-acetyltransferase [Caulobacteraceae bacterium]
MILHTERMGLRPLEAADAPAIYRMINDAEVMAYWDTVRMDDPTATDEIVARQLAEVAEARAIVWTMERSADGEVLGACDLSDIDRRQARAELGFIVARPHWADGYAGEAMHAVIGHAAQGLRLKRLEARVHIGNQRAMQLIEGLGFRREGLMRGNVERDGERRDLLIFALPL